jgi:hypothetical protein
VSFANSLAPKRFMLTTTCRYDGDLATGPRIVDRSRLCVSWRRFMDRRDVSPGQAGSDTHLASRRCKRGVTMGRNLFSNSEFFHVYSDRNFCTRGAKPQISQASIRNIPSTTGLVSPYFLIASRTASSTLIVLTPTNSFSTKWLKSLPQSSS